MTKIVLHPPNPSWPGDFAALRTALAGVAPGNAIIHHIGSTAVPGLAAKNVIDVQISVDSFADVDARRFEDAGFGQVARLVSDHCPPGLDLPVEDLTKLFFKAAARDANIHIRQKGRFNQRFSLLCRDFLRTHPVAARAYELIKIRLAEHVADDADAYYDIKDPVFDIIVEGANEWALRTGWTEPPGD